MPPLANATKDAALYARLRGVAFVITAIGFALIGALYYSGNALNRAAQQAETIRFDSALSSLLNRTLMEQKAWAYWDDAALAVQANPTQLDWLDIQVGVPLNQGFGHDRLFVLSPRNKPVYAFGQGKRLPTRSFESLRPSIAPLIDKVRRDAANGFRSRDDAFAAAQKRYPAENLARHARWAAAVLQSDRGPSIVSIITIIPNAEPKLLRATPHLLISVVPIDQTVFADLAHDAGLKSLIFSSMTQPGTGMPFLADDRRPMGRLAWVPERPGDFVLNIILPIAALLVIGGLGYIGIILHRLAVAHRESDHRARTSHFLAQFDALSHLPNRRHFTTTLEQKMGDPAFTSSSQPLCVAYIDIDHFKTVNDAIGHAAGDALVKQLGPRLRAELREGDMLARLGGDEFAILREAHGDPRAEASALSDAITTAFCEPFEVDGTHFEVTCSAGIAVTSPDIKTPDELLRAADIALYEAKDLGRNRVIQFETHMASDIRERHAIETDMRLAIGTNQFVMHYQPIVSIRTGRITSVEALVRWQHPTRGMIPPMQFIPIAEQSGLMNALGNNILELVFRDAPKLGIVDIAINLSPAQLRQQGLTERLLQLSEHHRVDRERIILEVTESMLVEADATTDATFAALHGLGFRMALDDFGTGYSSLGYLHRFKFDKVKIDRSFLANGARDRLRPIMEGIVHIGRGLRMDVVAEGVESQIELALVQAMGCNEAQGYHFARPLPLDEIVAFIAHYPEVPNEERHSGSLLRLAIG